MKNLLLKLQVETRKMEVHPDEDDPCELCGQARCDHDPRPEFEAFREVEV